MRWRTLLSVFFVAGLAACRQGGEEGRSEGETPAVSVAVSVDTARTDTALAEFPTKGGFDAKHSQELALQTDTAVRTDLRMMSRKLKVIYQPSHLYGEWTRGTEHEQYLSDGTGRFWDTGDDVGRGEALQFRWTLDSNVLRMVFSLTMGGVVPQEYLVTFVDDESLVYRDDMGDSYMWDKAADGSSDLPAAVPLASSGAATP